MITWRDEMEEWVTMEEAMAIIGCSNREVYRYKRNGRLRHLWPDGQKHPLFHGQDAVHLKAYRANPNKLSDAAKNRKPMNADTHRTISAICPRCGKRHKITCMWIGTGTPRLFCSKCREYSERWTSTYQNSARV